MLKRYFIFVLISFCSLVTAAQKKSGDSSNLRDPLDIDTTINYDELFSELESFMDSLLTPPSYLNVSIGLTQGNYNYRAKTAPRIRTVDKWTYSPTVAYYHKSGAGIAATGYLINDSGSLNAYQFQFTGSYDYLLNHDFATGISFTKYLSKDSLNFYVSPLQNEVSAYFTYRKTWIRPSVLVGYAWGSSKNLERRLNFINSLGLRRRGRNRQRNKVENVSDINLAIAAQHDFYWFHIFGSRGSVRLSPQFIGNFGTQEYGFNTSQSNNNVNKQKRSNILNSAKEFSLDTKKEFNPLSLGFNLKAEYAIGKFYIQPQLMLDYYFPAENKNFSTLFSLSTGFNF